MSLVHWLSLPMLGDERGSLVAVEAGRDIPFPVRRVYYIFSTEEGVSRGFHAHKALKQLLVCVSGSCRVLLDNGQENVNVWLDSPSKGLLVEGMIWREMHEFSADCVLLVLASEHYDEHDYIRDYDRFIELASGG